MINGPGPPQSPPRAPDNGRGRRNTIASSFMEWTSQSNAKRLQVVDDAACVLAVIAIVLMVVDNQCYTSRGEMNNALRGVITGLCFAIILLLYKAYQLELQALKISSIMPKEETLWSSGLWKMFLVEAFVCAWHIPPGVRWSMEARDTENNVIFYDERMLGLTVFLKLYLLFRSMRDHHSVSKGGGRFLCNMNNTEPSVYFVLKALLERYPFIVLGCIILGNLVVSSYALMICEQAARPEYMFSDAQWNLYIALTTVGFGDIYPLTYPGRTVVAISVFFGLCTTALLITVVQENLRLTKPQARVLDTLSESAFQKEYRNSAAACMQRLWRLHKELKAKAKEQEEAEAGGSVRGAGPVSPKGSVPVAAGRPTLRAALGFGGPVQRLPFDRRALRRAVMDFKMVRKRWREHQESHAHGSGACSEEGAEACGRLDRLEALVREVAEGMEEQRAALAAVAEAVGALAGAAGGGGGGGGGPEREKEKGGPAQAPPPPASAASASISAAPPAASAKGKPRVVVLPSSNGGSGVHELASPLSTLPSPLTPLTPPAPLPSPSPPSFRSGRSGVRLAPVMSGGGTPTELPGSLAGAPRPVPEAA
eukprot:tig00000042_g15464.t1